MEIGAPLPDDAQEGGGRSTPFGFAFLDIRPFLFAAAAGRTLEAVSKWEETATFAGIRPKGKRGRPSVHPARFLLEIGADLDGDRVHLLKGSPSNIPHRYLSINAMGMCTLKTHRRPC